MVTLMHRAELGMEVNTKTLSRIHKTHVNIGGWGFLCSPGNLVPMEHLGFNSALPSVASEPTAWEPGLGWVLTRQEGATWKLSLLWASVTLRRPDDWHSSASHLCTAVPGICPRRAHSSWVKDTAMSPKCYLGKMSGTNHSIQFPPHLPGLWAGSLFLCMGAAPSCPKASASSGWSWGSKALSALAT